MTDTAQLKTNMANAIRALSMDAVQKANSGHPGMPMGMADVATVLFTEHMAYDPKAPDWVNRDRFVLSAGHGSMLIYSLLYLAGYDAPTLDDIKNFRQLHSPTAGHPECDELAGVEVTTGPLGQGLATAVGLALGERMASARLGSDVIDHFTYVLAGDGCLMEGISQEAITLAGHLKLSKMIVLFDDNSISIDGGTELATSDNQAKRFEAAGWHVQKVDGHDMAAVSAAIAAAKASDKPSMIACKTVIGFGSPNKRGTAGVHGAPLGDAEIALTREELGWSHDAFDIPGDVLTAWRDAGVAQAKAHADWRNSLSADQQQAVDAFFAGLDEEAVDQALITHVANLIAEPQKVATRKASQLALEAFVPALPEMIGGSADLTGSNLTKVGGMDVVSADDFAATYIHYGIREFGMAAAMNGLALYGGFVPYGGTFLVFTDYARPAIRLGALMKVAPIYVMTHDSIGLGEDGPTHQPIEHLASLRAMPNTLVLRPCDTVETAECWAIAIKRRSGPSIISLSRQGVPQLRTTASSDNRSADGGYILKDCDGEPAVTIVATGTEVAIAVEAADQLNADGTPTRVVSMPSTELFLDRPEAEREAVLGGDSLKVVIEAATSFGWQAVVGTDAVFCTVDSFGASAPGPDLYQHFGLTPESVIAKIRNRL